MIALLAVPVVTSLAAAVRSAQLRHARDVVPYIGRHRGSTS